MAHTFAKPGELVTCPNGHELYRVRNVLVRNVAVKASDFKSVHPDMPDPDARTAIKPCCVCGARFDRVVQDRGYPRFQMHFSDGWRPHVEGF